MKQLTHFHTSLLYFYCGTTLKSQPCKEFNSVHSFYIHGQLDRIYHFQFFSMNVQSWERKLIQIDSLTQCWFHKFHGMCIVILLAAPLNCKFKLSKVDSSTVHRLLFNKCCKFHPQICYAVINFESALLFAIGSIAYTDWDTRIHFALAVSNLFSFGFLHRLSTRSQWKLCSVEESTLPLQ